jgi:hypothetical protein
MKRHTLAIASLLLLALSTTVGCYYDNEEELYPTDPNACDTANVSFSADILPIIQGNCAGCHPGSGGFPLENYANVKAKVDNGSLNLRLLINQDMPPAGNTELNQCQKLLIQSWIAKGAQDN